MNFTVAVLLAVVLLEETPVNVAGAEFEDEWSDKRMSMVSTCIERNANSDGVLEISIGDGDSKQLIATVPCSAEYCALEKPSGYEKVQLECEFVPSSLDTADTVTIAVGAIVLCILIFAAATALLCVRQWRIQSAKWRQWSQETSKMQYKATPEEGSVTVSAAMTDGLTTRRAQTNCAVEVAVTSECASTSAVDQRRDSGSSSDGTVYDEPWDSRVVDRLWTFYSEKDPDPAIVESMRKRIPSLLVKEKGNGKGQPSVTRDKC